MKAVSVLEHFSDHGSIHQKMKKNTRSVRSYPNSAGDGLEIELAIPFIRNMILKLILNKHSSVISRIIIHSNECITNSSDARVSISVSDFTQIFHCSRNSSLEHIERDQTQTMTPSPLNRSSVEAWILL
ncbi:hypothetical protein TNCV_2494821 [Trichonephila clavipes]|nr:hypothetical protein TNCV_2494821 [Trichonephila clavipes]